MTGKRDRKKRLRELKQYARFLDLELTELIVKEMKYDTKLRKKALKMAKKRRVGYIT